MRRGDDPQWRQLLDDSLRLRENPRRRRSIGINLTGQQNDIILAAATERGGMSLSSYTRRSALAVACFDLGLPWADVTADEAIVRPLDLAGRPFAADPGRGEGYGRWIITDMQEFRR